MVSSVSTYQIVKQYSKHNEATVSPARTADTAENQATPQAAAPSEQVTLSATARDKLRLSGAMRSYYAQAQETKKAKARERMAEIKRRIDELKAILMQFGAMAPKALLRELKQLAGELKGVAKDLQEGGSAASTVTAATPGVQTPAEQVQVTDAEGAGTADEQYAEPASVVNADIDNIDDAEAADEADSLDNTDDAQHATALEDEALMSAAVDAKQQQQLQQAQKESDKRELQKTLAALKSLVNMFKAMLRVEDKDKETKQQLNDIDKLLNDVQAPDITIAVDVSLA